MNKALCTAVMAVAALSAAAEGYQVNTFSAKQIGMGHVGVAMKLGAESHKVERHSHSSRRQRIFHLKQDCHSDECVGVVPYI